MPKPRALAWFIATALLGAAVPLAFWLYHIWPEPSPIIIGEHRSYWTDDGHWVVETDARTEDICLVVVNRQFVLRSGNGATVAVPPIRADMLRARGSAIPGTLPYAFTTSITEGTVHYVYDIEPGKFSHQLLEINAFDCERGFKGEVGRWSIPVDTPSAIPAPPSTDGE